MPCAAEWSFTPRLLNNTRCLGKHVCLSRPSHAGFGGRQRSPGEAERRRQKVGPCLSNSPGSDLPVMLDVRTNEPCKYHTASVRLYGSYYSY